jgi:hypothetical protein
MLKRFKGHLDTANLHKSRSSCERFEYFHVLRVPHQAYGPDPAPSDFFFFGYSQSKLERIALRSRPELRSAIGEIVDEIFKEMFLAA